MNNKRNTIIGVLLLLVLMTIGYALFSEKVSIKGTAKAKGDFDVTFENVHVSNKEGVSNFKLIVANDKKSFSLTDLKLDYPGADLTVKYSVKNNGSVPVLYKSKNVNLTEDDYYNLKKINLWADVSNVLYLEPGETREDDISFWWYEFDKDYTLPSESINVTYDIVYNQVNGKNDACNYLKTLADNIFNYEGLGEPYVSINEGDINGDGFIDSGDSSLIEYFLYDIKCLN